MVYSLHQTSPTHPLPSSSHPPPLNANFLTSSYGDVAQGNPYTNDDTLATPTPTEGTRNGMGVDGAGYMAGYWTDEGSAGMRGGLEYEYPSEALLQLRFIDEMAEQQGHGQGHNGQGSAGFGTAL